MPPDRLARQIQAVVVVAQMELAEQAEVGVLA
jgi:hypothetical protein